MVKYIQNICKELSSTDGSTKFFKPKPTSFKVRNLKFNSLNLNKIVQEALIFALYRWGETYLLRHVKCTPMNGTVLEGM